MDVHDLALQGIKPTSTTMFFHQSGTAYQTSMNDNTMPKLPISAARNNVDNITMFKTGICRNFWSTGTCRFGDKCTFAHGSQELRKSKMTNQNTMKGRVCRFSMEKCPYGEKCIFPHQRSKACEEKGDIPLTCNYGSKSTDAHGLAEVRRSAPILVSQSGNAWIAPTPLVKDALPNHSPTPTATAYKLLPRACFFKRKTNKKVVGIYADWIDEEFFASYLVGEH